MSRHYDDDDDTANCDLKSMRQVYGALVREGASEDELAAVSEDKRGQRQPVDWGDDQYE